MRLFSGKDKKVKEVYTVKNFKKCSKPPLSANQGNEQRACVKNGCARGGRQHALRR
jgi:hypothetical protein